MDTNGEVKSRGLGLSLDDQIQDSGDFYISPEGDEIQFSGYSGWDIHPELVQHMAKQLPQAIQIKVVGFDMDDYPNDKAAIFIVEGGTGYIQQFTRHSAEKIAQDYFPQLFQNLQNE